MQPLAYDITRLFVGPLMPAPRGIDRVDLILARYFFESADWDAYGLLPTPWGVRIFEGQRVIRAMDRLELIWKETADAHADPAFAWVKNRLLGKPAGTAPRSGKFTTFDKVMRMGSMLMATGIVPGRSARRALPAKAPYLNIGQISLALPFMFRWLRRRPDVHAVFMLHDVIPIEFPDLVPRASTSLHKAMVRTTARYAKGVIVSTQHARDTVAAELARHGCADVAMLSAMLPLHPGFDDPASPDPELLDVSYFLVVGAIETRKNLLLLLETWKLLEARLGANTPQLVLAGSVHAGGREIMDAFFASRRVAPYVHFISGLSTASIGTLILGARALLMPSLAEGFGLPIIEAQALDCPVIVSDIPAHREVAGGTATLLPTDRPDLWADAVAKTPRQESRLPTPRCEVRAARRDYVQQIEAFLKAAN